MKKASTVRMAALAEASGAGKHIWLYRHHDWQSLPDK